MCERERDRKREAREKGERETAGYELLEQEKERGRLDTQSAGTSSSRYLHS